MTEQSGPMGLVHDRESASPAGNGLVSRYLVDLEPLRRRTDVVAGDVERRRLGGEGVEHVLGGVGRALVFRGCRRGSAWFATENGNARFGVASGHVGRGVEVGEIVMKGPTI